MKPLLAFIVALLLVVPSFAATVKSHGFASTTVRQLDKLIQAQARRVNFGLAVQAVNSPRQFIYFNVHKRFTPASILKLYTAAAALYYLGPHFRYQTEILLDPNDLKAGVLHGDLVVRFSGDPTLTRTQIDALFATLAAKGVREIDGRVILDGRVFSAQGYAKGWMWDDLNICYAAPVTAIIINRNCFQFKLVAADKPKQPAQMIAQPLPFTPVINTVTTVNKNSAQNCPLQLKATKDNVYELSGCMQQQAKPLTFTVAIKNVPHYAEAVVRAAIVQAGIALDGKIISAGPHFKEAQNTEVIARTQSVDLTVLVREMLKDSSNIIADSLVKTLAVAVTDKQGTWRAGLKAINTILTQRAHLNFSHIVMVDGSGLSRYDLSSPLQMLKLLTAVHQNFYISPEFLAALPVGGVDGTLAKRFKGDLTGEIRAKTGSMTGVGALAGFIRTKQGQTLAFVLMINGIIGSNYRYRVFEQRVLSLLAAS